MSSDHRGHHGAVRRESSVLNMIAYKLYLVCLPMAKHRCKSEVSLFIGCEGNGLCNPRTIRTAFLRQGERPLGGPLLKGVKHKEHPGWMSFYLLNLLLLSTVYLFSL